MPRKRIKMSKVREIFRLREECKLSRRQVADFSALLNSPLNCSLFSPSI